ncbi:MAG: hypothetical protein JXR07_16005 [Reichenbachiella sp.]
MKLLIVSSVLISWIVLSSFSSVPYEWKDQKIQFHLPDFFLEEKSSDAEFVAKGRDVVFQLNVYMDELIEENQLKSFVSKIGIENFGLSQSKEFETINSKGFKGHCVKGLADGNLIYVVGLIDVDSGISYYGMIKYKGASNVDLSVARSIISSVEKYH